MAKKLYVGNLPWSVKTDDLQQLFADFGELEDVFVMTDRATGRSKGFGFVTFANDADAETAISEMNGKEVGEPGRERALTVDEARPPRERNEF